MESKRKERKQEERIAAIVVTYNRKKLLKECLNALLKQTRKLDSIIIVDNNSNDGTKEMLEREFLKNKIFDYVKLKENSGSGGGQYTGIKRAYEKGYDWIWCLDDDGIPEENALEQLLKHKDKNTVLNSLVIDKNNKSLLAFGLRDELKQKVYYKIDELKNLSSVDGTNPFNCTLIPKEIIRKIGLPDKNLFIWGDEREYYQRILANHFKLKTIINSKVYHPGILNNYKRTFLGTIVCNIPSWKIYYRERNTIFIYKKYWYKKLFYFIPLHIIKFLLQIIFYEKDKVQKIKALFKGVWHGIINKIESPTKILTNFK